MDDSKDIYIPRQFRVTGEESVRKIWQKIPANGGQFVSLLRMQLGNAEQEMLDTAIREWVDHNVLRMRNPTNPFVKKRPQIYWDRVDCPRCNKECHSFSSFHEHWKEESRTLDPDEVKKYLVKMKDWQGKE
jgi:hypothetical protein